MADLNGVAAIITATGTAAATILTQLLTWHSNKRKLEEAQVELAELKMDHQRVARDLGQRTRDLQDQLGTIDDRTGSTQRIAEGLAFAAASGNTPPPAPLRAQAPPAVQPIPTQSQPGYKR